MHGCSWKEGREGLLKSSTLGKGERRGWVRWRDGVCFPQGDAASHCYKHSQTLHSSLSLLLIHPTYPLWTLTHPPWRTPPATRHTWPMLGVAVCVLGGERKGGGWVGVCGLCLGVCHLLSYNTLGIVCICVYVWGKRAGSWGTHPVRMLCYYLSSRGYESPGMVSGKRERPPQQ